MIRFSVRECQCTTPSRPRRACRPHRAPYHLLHGLDLAWFLMSIPPGGDASGLRQTADREAGGEVSRKTARKGRGDRLAAPADRATFPLHGCSPELLHRDIPSAERGQRFRSVVRGQVFTTMDFHPCRLDRCRRRTCRAVFIAPSRSRLEVIRVTIAPVISRAINTGSPHGGKGSLIIHACLSLGDDEGLCLHS